MTDEQNLPERRKGYAELKEELDKHVSEIEQRLGRWLKRGLIAFGLMGLACSLALIGFGFALHEIQQQRHDYCVEQNVRHDNTVKRLTDIFPAGNTTEAKKAQANTISLIDALAPKQDCDEVGKVRIGP